MLVKEERRFGEWGVGVGGPSIPHPRPPLLKEKGNKIRLRNMKSSKYFRDTNSYSAEPFKKRKDVVTLSLPKGDENKVLTVNHASASSA